MKEQRNLDGIFFRVERDGKWENICFSDLTDEEMNEVLKDKDMEWTHGLFQSLISILYQIENEHEEGNPLKNIDVFLSKTIANRIYELGEKHNIVIK